MSYFILIISSALAGIGTGLIGLSAATAMVPILIVLCPGFQGEHGAYMATAIALASDILGSAITTAVYAKNKNIDLKRGRIMLISIIGMCTIGSVAAYFTRQAVLGGFTLFLCVAIGLRFLIKPDSKKPEGDVSSEKLTKIQIAGSLFFGITIGFGTGFFGSGGGMMMLVIFTALLKFDRKTAVGTSTFIMTFTALIASVSHMAMEPAILFERWDFLIIAIVTETLFSLLSAQFANRVNNALVGWITGSLLFYLGVFLNFTQYRDYIPDELLYGSLQMCLVFVKYIVICIVAVLGLRLIFRRMPSFVWRKLLHVIAYSCIIPFTFFSESWKYSVGSLVIIMCIITPPLFGVDLSDRIGKIFVEKFRYEIITSFLLLFGMLALTIGICWGRLDKQYICVVAIMSWGPGDAMAAIVGITKGKHKLKGRLIEGTKSVEGCIAMALTSFVCTLVCLCIWGPYGLFSNLFISFIIAIVAAFVELFTKWGLDTVTVPIVSSLILLAVNTLL